MPYGLKLFLYAALWCVVGSVVGFRLSDSNLFIVFGIALLMAVRLGRWLFGREGL